MTTFDKSIHDDQRERKLSFNVGEYVKLKFANQYGWINRIGLISQAGCPVVEVTWLYRLTNEGTVDETFLPSLQICYKESLLSMGREKNIKEIWS